MPLPQLLLPLVLRALPKRLLAAALPLLLVCGSERMEAADARAEEASLLARLGGGCGLLDEAAPCAAPYRCRASRSDGDALSPAVLLRLVAC